MLPVYNYKMDEIKIKIVDNKYVHLDGPQHTFILDLDNAEILAHNILEFIKTKKVNHDTCRNQT